MTKINVTYIPTAWKVKLWWSSAIFPGVNGIAEWQQFSEPWEVSPDADTPINDLDEESGEMELF